MSAFSGSRQARSWLIVFPAVENVRSDGVEEACTQRYLLAKTYKIGRVSFMFHHHATGLMDDRDEGRPL